MNTRVHGRYSSSSCGPPLLLEPAYLQSELAKLVNKSLEAKSAEVRRVPDSDPKRSVGICARSLTSGVWDMKKNQYPVLDPKDADMAGIQDSLAGHRGSQLTDHRSLPFRVDGSEPATVMKGHMRILKLPN